MSILTLALASLVATSATAQSTDVPPSPTRGVAPAPVAAPAGSVTPDRAAPCQESLDTPEPLSAVERSALVAARQDGSDLAAMRAGSEPTDSEWGWLAAGAGIVLLIFLI